MEPDETLAAIRDAIQRARAAKTEGEKVRWMADAIRNFEDLDHWMINNGRPPTDWPGEF